MMDEWKIGKHEASFTSFQYSNIPLGFTIFNNIILPTMIYTTAIHNNLSANLV